MMVLALATNKQLLPTPHTLAVWRCALCHNALDWVRRSRITGR